MTAVSVVLKATALLAVAVLVQAFLRRRGSAAARHLVWTSVLAAVLVLPLADAALPHWTMPIPIAGAVAPAPEREALSARSSSRSIPAEREALAERRSTLWERQTLADRSAVIVPSAMAVMYLAGVLLLFARLAWESFALRRLARASRDVADPGWQRLLDETTTDLHIARPVRLLQTADEMVPITFGTLEPAVVVPASADVWSEDRRRAVLLHELAHVARRDCLAQLVGASACAIYWPHPGVWWAARRLRVERELACDDRVLAAGTEPHAYAGHLLELARSLYAEPAPATALAMARARDLETRLRAVVDTARNHAALPRRGSVVAIAATMAIGLPTAAMRAAVTPVRSGAGIEFHAAVTALRSVVAAAQGEQDLSGTWEVRLSPDGATAHVTVRTAHSSHGETVPTARLQELAGVRVAAADGPVHFSIRREQGTFAGDGTCRAGICAGTAAFTPDPAFAAGLATRGIGAPAPADALQMAVHDVGFAFLDELAKDGYAKPDVQGLVGAAQHGVGLAYVREMTTLGYRLGALDALIRLRDHGIDPAYIRDMAANGMGQLSADDLVRARDHGVDPTYIEGMRALGLGSFGLDGFINARDHGVDPQFARGLAALGFEQLTFADLVAARDHGVDPSYARGMRDLGHRLSFADLFRAREHGVDPPYVSGLASLGYKGQSLDALINLRDHGVDPAYAAGLAALGYPSLSLDTLVRMRDHGVDPEYVRRLKEKGMTNLTPDQLIERRDRGLDDPATAARDLVAALRTSWRSLVAR